MHIIKAVDLTQLKNQRASQFFGEAEALIKSVYGTETCGEAVDFLEASQSFELALKGCSVDEAALLQEADDAADESWGALEMQIRASLRHPNPERRAAAASVYMIFAEFDNPTRLNYDEEYALIRTQLDALGKLSAETLKLALIDEHVTALEACYGKFVGVLSSAKDGSKRPSLCKKMREKAREAFEQFAETLNVMVRISKDERYVRLVDGINEIIDKLDARK